jgi:hypothetical protein
MYFFLNFPLLSRMAVLSPELQGTILEVRYFSDSINASRFKHIMWTSHKQQPGEMRGKASNVDWAARGALLEFRLLGVHLHQADWHTCSALARHSLQACFCACDVVS